MVLIAAIVLLLSVVGFQAQKGVPCQGPSFRALAYTALRNAPHIVNYDNITGNRLVRPVNNPDDVSILLYPTKKNVYIRKGKNCTYEYNPYLYSSQIGINNDSIYDGEVILDGETFYSWRQTYPNTSTIVVMSEYCIPKIAHIMTEIGRDLFTVLYNVEVLPDGSAARDFDFSNCQKA